MVIELFITYCLLTNDKKCVEVHQNLPEDIQWITPMECMISAQDFAPEYLKEHPSYRMSGYRCEVDIPKHKDT